MMSDLDWDHFGTVYTRQIQNVCSKHESKASRSPWSWCTVIPIRKCSCSHVGGVFRADLLKEKRAWSITASGNRNCALPQPGGTAVWSVCGCYSHLPTLSVSVSLVQGTPQPHSCVLGFSLVVPCPWIVANGSSCEGVWNQKHPLSPSWWCHPSILVNSITEHSIPNNSF